jgi:hypothetical protein
MQIKLARFCGKCVKTYGNGTFFRAQHQSTPMARRQRGRIRLVSLFQPKSSTSRVGHGPDRRHLPCPSNVEPKDQHVQPAISESRPAVGCDPRSQIPLRRALLENAGGSRRVARVRHDRILLDLSYLFP